MVYSKSVMSLEESKMLCKPPMGILDYLGNNNFEWGIKFKILFVGVYTTVYHLDCTRRKLLLLTAACCFRLWSAGKLQAPLSLWDKYPVGSVITNYRQAEEKNQPKK